VPMFTPPVRADVAPDQLHTLHAIQGMDVFMRLALAQQVEVHNRFSVNPDTAMMQYKFPPSLKPQPLVPLNLDMNMGSLDSSFESSIDFGDGVRAALVRGGEASGELANDMGAPRVAIQIKIDRVCGALHGHGHVPRGGKVYVHMCIVDTRQKLKHAVVTAPHTDKTVISTALRILTKRLDDGTEVWDSVQGADVFNTRAIFEGDEEVDEDDDEAGGEKMVSVAPPEPDQELEYAELDYNDGCMFTNVPARGEVAIVFKVYQEEHNTQMASGDQRPGPGDVLIAWATLRPFDKRPAGLKGPSNKTLQSSAIAEQGLKLKAGVFEIDLLAPPIDEWTPQGQAWSEQRKAADMLTIDGLVSHVPGSATILNHPLPVMSIKVEGFEKEGPSLLGKLRANANKLVAGAMLKNILAKKVDTIWNFRDSEAWIPCGDPPVARDLFAADDGFDIYIDAARYLPDNVTLSAVQCFLTSKDMKPYGNTFKEIDLRSQSVMSPMYLGRKEFRRDPAREWDPTLTLLFKIVATEFDMARAPAERSQTLSLCNVGFAVLHVFVDPFTKQQPTSNTLREYSLNEGAFQLSVHRKGLKPKEAMSNQALLDELRRFCTTLLVRLVKAPRTVDGLTTQSSKDYMLGREDAVEKAGLLVRPKPYKQGRYSSDSYSTPLPIEEFLYPSRLLKDKLPLTCAAALVDARGGSRLSPEEEESIKDLETFDPDRFNAGMKNLRKALRSILRASDPSRSVNIRYHYPNFPENGFCVSIDGIENFPQSAGYTWVGAMCSAFPPAMYYSSGFKVSADLKLIHKLNYESDVNCPRWTDGYHWYNQCDPDQHGHMVVIIDVRARVIYHKEFGPKAKPNKVLAPRMVQIGFSILPIFTRGGAYTQSGNWKLPLFRLGPRPADMSPRRYWNLDVDEETANGQKKPLVPKPGDEVVETMIGAPNGPNHALLDRISLSTSGAHDAVIQALTLGEVHLVDSCSVLCRVNDGSRYADELETPFHTGGGPLNVDDTMISNYMPGEMFQQYNPVKMKTTIKDHIKREVKDTEEHIKENCGTLTQQMNLPDAALQILVPDHPNCTSHLDPPGGSQALSRAAAPPANPLGAFSRSGKTGTAKPGSAKPGSVHSKASR